MESLNRKGQVLLLRAEKDLPERHKICLQVDIRHCLEKGRHLDQDEEGLDFLVLVILWRK